MAGNTTQTVLDDQPGYVPPLPSYAISFQTAVPLPFLITVQIAASVAVPSIPAYYWPAAWRRQHCGKNYLEVVHDIVGVPHQFAPMFFPTDAEVAQALAIKAGRRVIGWCLAGDRLAAC